MAFDASSTLRFASDLLIRNTNLKLIALLLTAVLFVLTRNEVTRVFEVPLRAVPDPDRILLTELPPAVQVQVRGPWTRINRLQAYDLGNASLDLRTATPGPMKIDQASIVMPPGVLLSDMQYDQVDLRFDPIESLSVPVSVQVTGQPHPDHRLVRTESDPSSITLQGGRSQLRRVTQISTEALNVEGAVGAVEGSVAIVLTEPALTVVGGATEGTVRVRAIVEPRPESREFRVPVSLPIGVVDPQGSIPTTVEVRGSGTRPSFRKLDDLGPRAPLRTVVEVGPPRPGEGGREVRVDVEWEEDVPEDLRDEIVLERRRFAFELLEPVAPSGSTQESAD